MTVTMCTPAEMQPMTDTSREPDLGRSVTRSAVPFVTADQSRSSRSSAPKTVLCAPAGVAAYVGIVDDGPRGPNAVGVL